jgi:iron-sulfur cluster assembly accessory protein
MITVTDAAASKIKSLLEQQGKPDYGLRMRVVGGGCSGLQYQLNFEEKAGPTDRVLETKGIKIFIDMKSSLYLVGSELDYVDGLMGAGFKINNPNAKSTCGCGESFQA